MLMEYCKCVNNHFRSIWKLLLLVFWVWVSKQELQISKQEEDTCSLSCGYPLLNGRGQQTHAEAVSNPHRLWCGHTEPEALSCMWMQWLYFLIFGWLCKPSSFLPALVFSHEVTISCWFWAVLVTREECRLLRSTWAVLLFSSVPVLLIDRGELGGEDQSGVWGEAWKKASEVGWSGRKAAFSQGICEMRRSCCCFCSR